MFSAELFLFLATEDKGEPVVKRLSSIFFNTWSQKLYTISNANKSILITAVSTIWKWYL